MVDIIETRDGLEAVVSSSTCPKCGHAQTDAVHPVLGPWVSCICEECGGTFNDSDLDAPSQAAWEAARATAETLPDMVYGASRPSAAWFKPDALYHRCGW